MTQDAPFPINSPSFLSHLVDEDGAVLHGHDPGDVVGVVDPRVPRPRHELDGRVRLDVALDDALQVARDVLHRRIVDHAGGVCKKRDPKWGAWSVSRFCKKN